MKTEIENTLQPYRIVGENLISVCMCCFPGRSIIERFPDLRGVNISHGICKAHADRWIADIRLKRLSEELRANNTAYYRMRGAR